MPELAELKLTADYINESSRGLSFTKIQKNPEHKGAEVNIQFNKFQICAESRGKELVVYLLEHKGVDVIPLRMTMGMSGHFRMTKTGEENKHAHLNFYSTDGNTLSFVDVRRFGKWKLGHEWSDNRGPDPTEDFKGFTENIMDNLTKKEFDKPIHLVMMNQKYFNGIGNYLRAEILYRIPELNPFISAREAITEFPKILEYCKLIPEYAYQLGGGKIKDWKNPFEEISERSTFFRCYSQPNMANGVDKGGRRFWFDPKWIEYLNTQK